MASFVERSSPTVTAWKTMLKNQVLDFTLGSHLIRNDKTCTCTSSAWDDVIEVSCS